MTAPPEPRRVRVTTSWDDGHVLDLRVAELLEKYDLKGTFYVAPRDRLHAPQERLIDADISFLAQRHEIGAHTFTHPNLAQVSLAEGREEIRLSKEYLEDVLGHEVTSFCYPYGAYRPDVKKAVQELGFRYARTVKRFRYRAHDPLEAPTTVHTYDHWSDAPDILGLARFNPQLALKYRDWSQLAVALFDECLEFGGDFHLWGHSWELEEHGHWKRLERVLAHIAAHRGEVQAITNAQLLPGQTATPRPKLLLSASHFPPKVGGLERYAEEIARGAQADGQDVVVLTSGEQLETRVERRPDGLKVYHLGTHLKLSNTPVGLHWLNSIRRIVEFERPGLVNPHMPVPYLGDLTVRAAGNIPVVVTYHSGSMKKRNFVLDRITEVYENLVLPLALRRARHIICSSDSVRDGFLKRYRHKSTTVTPGVDRDLFRARRAPPAGRQVLFIGNFSYAWKGLDYLREAVKLLPDVELNIIGTGEAVPQERTRYLGVLHGQELVRAIQAADVLVLPSTAESESFGMVLVEAMSCGVPVIGSRIGGIPYVISDGQDGLLTRPRDAQDIARAIRVTLDDPQATAVRVQQALHKVQTQFDWKTSILPRYLDILKRVKQESTEQTSADRAARRTATHVTAYYPPHLGGMELVAQSLSHELARQGVQVQVITSNVGVQPQLAERDPNPAVQYLSALEIAHTPLAPGLLPALWRAPQQTVYHLHAAQAYWPEVMMLVATVRRQPYIVHFHLDVEASGPLGFLLGTYKNTLFRMVMRRAARVIVLQEDQRRLVAHKYGVPPHSISVIPNAVRPEFYLERQVQPHTPLRLLYVGRLTVQKRVDRLLDMAALLGPRVHLNIVGDGEDREQLREQAQRLGLQNVQFSGVKRDAELIDAYREADVFITASDREGMPLTLLEAMATGLPVIGSDVIGLHDLIENVGLLVSPPEPAAFARTVEALLNDPQRLTELSRASREKAQAHSWTNISRDITALYEELWP